MATTIGSANAIDVNTIVSQLMSIERLGLNKYVTKETSYTTKISAWSTIRGSISNLQSSLAGLNNLSSYQSTTATASRIDSVTVTAQATAATGTHTVSVQQLAEAHRIATGPLAGGATAAIGSGTLSFQFGTYSGGGSVFTVNGSRPSGSVTIAPGASALDVMNAVNTANIGVSASIVNDGTGDRLIFASKYSGVANALNVTTTDDDGTDTDALGLSQLVYNPPAGASALTEITAGRDAQATVDGLPITSALNTLDTTLTGLAINLLRVDTPGATTTLTVSRTAGAIRGSIDRFVSAYNDAMKAVNDALKYDPVTRRAGALNGDASLQGLQSQLRIAVTQSLALVPGDFASLGEIGIKLGAGGLLTVDSTKLDDALRTDGDKVARLLARTGATDSPGLTYKSSATSTAAGLYDVNLTAVATQAKLVASAPPNLTIVAGINDSLDVGIDGIAGTIVLPAGTYASTAALAADLQSRINGLPGMSTAGSSVSVAVVAGQLEVTSNKFGAVSTIAMSGIAASDLFGATPTSTSGADAVATIGGIDATATGRTLTGAGPAEGLVVDVGAGVIPGGAGTVRVYEGFAAKLDRILSSAISTTGGLFQTRIDGLNVSVKDVQKDRASFETQLTFIEIRYRHQFDALNAAVARMQATSTYLTAQLAQIAANNTSRRQ